jgi:hypothetical protein
MLVVPTLVNANVVPTVLAKTAKPSKKPIRILVPAKVTKHLDISES